MEIPRKAYTNRVRNEDVEEAHPTTEVRLEEAVADLAKATAAPTTSPKDLDPLQKTRAYSGAAVRGSTVLATNRTNHKRTREAYRSRS